MTAGKEVCNVIHTMSRRINVMIDEDTWAILGRVPTGERSRTINEALRAWALRHRRQEAARKMDALRARMPTVTTADIVRWIREDRGSRLMSAPLLVLDASVVLKWALPTKEEPHTVMALQLRDAIVQESVVALVPTLWRHEIGNTLARRFPVHAGECFRP